MAFFKSIIQNKNRIKTMFCWLKNACSFGPNKLNGRQYSCLPKMSQILFFFWNSSKMVLLENRNILFFGKSNYKWYSSVSPRRWCSFTLSGAKAETTRGQWKNEWAWDEKMENENMKKWKMNELIWNKALDVDEWAE